MGKKHMSQVALFAEAIAGGGRERLMPLIKCRSHFGPLLLISPTRPPARRQTDLFLRTHPHRQLMQLLSSGSAQNAEDPSRQRLCIFQHGAAFFFSPCGHMKGSENDLNYRIKLAQNLQIFKVCLSAVQSNKHLLKNRF
jgi:hypothetical protein